MKELPIKFKERMQHLLGDAYLEYENALSCEPQRAFRVNTDKISAADFEAINPFGNEKIPYVENGYYLQFDRVGNHPFHHAGMIYVQEPAAMAPAECIDIPDGAFVLDMCAAPGGKSTQLRNKLNGGVLVSNEIVPSRCKILTGNIERLGLKNCVTTCMDTNRLASLFPHTFDVIIADVPCSGEGMFRKDEAAINEWSLENVENCALRQSEILENAAKCLKDGGQIIYATCTFSLEENEMVVDRFLKSHPDFELAPVKQEVKDASSDGICFCGCQTPNIHFVRRFYPHTSRGEGQFMAVLRHKGASDLRHACIQSKPFDNPLLLQFLDDTLIYYDRQSVRLYGDTPVFFDADIKIDQGVAFMCGVTIGEIKRNYILPHHQFFMAYGNHFKRKIELEPESDSLMQYLRGQEIKADCESGWAVVTVCGVAVGGAKVSNGVAKNHYPKGLRLLN